MEFCRFSSECILDGSTLVDNVFIENFLPKAPENAVKVYLYGLYKCSHPSAYNNTATHFAAELGLTLEEIESAYVYLEQEGLVNLIVGTEMQVQYLPIKNAVNNIKKFNKSKYAEFNKKAQALISGRMITVTEYTEYYTLIEVYDLNPNALILIISYCTELKGANVGYRYILTVAKNWIAEGLRTYDEILEKIRTYNAFNSEISEILKICGIKRMATVEENDKFLKWKNNFGFEMQVIKYVASLIAEKYGKVNFALLDTKLLAYYEARRFSVEEIDDFDRNQKELFALAKEVCKNLGIYYENLNIVVEKYITKWLDHGHSPGSILLVAALCFKKSIKSLEGLDNNLAKLYKLGIIDENSIEEYVNNLLQKDQILKNLLEKIGITRHITHQDREFFKTWTENWKFGTELIEHAAEKAIGKNLPVQYMNKLLSLWFSNGVKTVEEANNVKVDFSYSNKTNKPEKLKKEDLSALFDSLEEVEI